MLTCFEDLFFSFDYNSLEPDFLSFFDERYFPYWRGAATRRSALGFVTSFRTLDIES